MEPLIREELKILTPSIEDDEDDENDEMNEF